MTPDERIAELNGVLAEQRQRVLAQNTVLQARVEELEARLAKDSHRRWSTGILPPPWDLEEARPARCVALQRRPNLIRSTTLFHWWPKRIKKRQGSRRNERLWFRVRRLGE